MKSRNLCDLVTTTITTTSPTNTATTSPVTRRSTIRANCNNSRNNNKPITSTTFCKWPLHPTRQWPVWPPWPVPTAFSVNWPPRVWHKAATTTTPTTTTAFFCFFFKKKEENFSFFCHPIPKKKVETKEKVWRKQNMILSLVLDGAAAVANQNPPFPTQNGRLWRAR